MPRFNRVFSSPLFWFYIATSQYPFVLWIQFGCSSPAAYYDIFWVKKKEKKQASDFCDKKDRHIRFSTILCWMLREKTRMEIRRWKGQKTLDGTRSAYLSIILYKRVIFMLFSPPQFLYWFQFFGTRMACCCYSSFLFPWNKKIIDDSNGKK